MQQRVRITSSWTKSFVCQTTPHFDSTSREVSYSVPRYHTRYNGKSKCFLENFLKILGIRKGGQCVLFNLMKILYKIHEKPLLFVRFPFIINFILIQGGTCVGELIAVLSGKGGTGKTSICAGIATALALSGEKVLCIDCDVGLRNLDIALGLSEISALSFVEICSGGYTLEMAVHHPLYSNLHFLTAPVNGTSAEVDPFAFADMLNRARKQYSYVLLDAPAGIDAGFRLAARFADRIILVTGADPAAIRDAARAGEILELMDKHNVRLIVNRLNKKTMRTTGMTVDDIMDRAGLPLLGIVPEDIHVMLSAGYKCPLLQCTRRGAAAACRRIAKRIQGYRVPLSL